MHFTRVDVGSGFDKQAYGCNHNGDFSGNVLVQVPIRDIPVLMGLMGEAVVKRLMAEQDKPSTELTAEVRIPFEVMRELVGQWIKDSHIEQLEDLSGREYLDELAGRNAV